MKEVKDLMRKKKNPKKKETKKKRNFRHPGFCAACILELREDANYLEIEEEHSFAQFPLRSDLLILKVKEHKIDKDIGKIFRTCNVIEYKSPTDPISIDDYHQLTAYANICAYSSKNRTKYPAKEITATLVYHSYPDKTIEELKEFGFCIEERPKGIYDVINDSPIPTQIVVIDDLEKDKYLFFSAISQTSKDNDLKAFVDEGQKLKDKDDKYNFERVLDQSHKVKPDYYDYSHKEENGEDKMIPELREYYKDDLKAEFKRGEIRGEETGFKRGEETGSLNTRKQIVKNLWKNGMSLSELAKIAETEESTIQAWLDEDETSKSNLS
jgi:hypothetical protein